MERKLYVCYVFMYTVYTYKYSSLIPVDCRLSCDEKSTCVRPVHCQLRYIYI